MTDQPDETQPTNVANTPSASEQSKVATEGDILPPTPANHVRNMGRLRSEQQWEIVREHLHPMVMQNRSGAAIASEFGISVDTAYRWRKRLLEELRHEAVAMQPRDFIMESLSSLRRARGEAWDRFEAAQDETSKRACLNLIIQTENHFARIGERIGFYGRAGDRPMEAKSYGEFGGDNGEEGIRTLQKMLLQFMSEPDAGDKTVEVVDERETYDDLLSEVRAEVSEPTLDVVTDMIVDDPAQLARLIRRRRPPAISEPS
ncbi:hypothetical protein CLV78_1252 [Aliiruegeria haliotis]|uniref:Insertion element IS150 protein InsJ-like helix-turn-helix domain-containing protein n=1 Tax=Aliiruegeria haliotis TaxID=1280846 RepID=A0A2T0RDM3_9RHOB|nr:helix-turn-helix domain-containing protein [Aliiruegeria haliotis]PRY19286.1 hypothetical protein CLV78_1252 [Aliiruegeria haliotis]